MLDRATHAGLISAGFWGERGEAWTKSLSQLSLGRRWIQHWHWQSQGAEWPCAPVTPSQMIHYNWRRASSRTCDAHAQMSGQQLCSIISQPWDSGTEWVGSRKGWQCGNHKQKSKWNITPNPAFREGSRVQFVIRADGGHTTSRASTIDSCIKAMEGSLSPSSIISNGNK